MKRSFLLITLFTTLPLCATLKKAPTSKVILSAFIDVTKVQRKINTKAPTEKNKIQNVIAITHKIMELEKKGLSNLTKIESNQYMINYVTRQELLTMLKGTAFSS